MHGEYTEKEQKGLTCCQMKRPFKAALLCAKIAAFMLKLKCCCCRGIPGARQYHQREGERRKWWIYESARRPKVSLGVWRWVRGGQEESEAVKLFNTDSRKRTLQENPELSQDKQRKKKPAQLIILIKMCTRWPFLPTRGEYTLRAAVLNTRSFRDAGVVRKEIIFCRLCSQRVATSGCLDFLVLFCGLHSLWPLSPDTSEASLGVFHFFEPILCQHSTVSQKAQQTNDHADHIPSHLNPTLVWNSWLSASPLCHICIPASHQLNNWYFIKWPVGYMFLFSFIQVAQRPDVWNCKGPTGKR